MKWVNPGHEFDEIGKKFEGVEEIIVYGAGEYGTRLGTLLNGIKAPFIYVDDYKSSKDIVHQVRVISSKNLDEEMCDKKCIIVLALGEVNSGVILKQLELRGYKYGEDIFDWRSFISFYIYIYSVYNLNKCFMLDCAAVGVYKCSLRCKHCCESVPYMKNKTDRPFSEIKPDIDALFAKIDYIQEFGLACGDLFLYNELEEFISYVMEHYSEQIGNCCILVNGMVIPRKSILETIKKYNLHVSISNYTSLKGWSERHDELVKVLRENKIEVVDVPMETWVDMGWAEKKFHQDAEALFDACGIRCSIVLDGKLYYCAHALLARKALHEDLDDSSESLNLLDKDADDKKKVLEYLLGYQKNGYLQMCHFCNGDSNINYRIISSAEQIKE